MPISDTKQLADFPPAGTVAASDLFYSASGRTLVEQSTTAAQLQTFIQAPIANSTLTSAAALSGNETVPVGQGGGLYQSTLAKIAQWAIGTYQGFTQSGTGAIARSVQSKLQDVVSILDFGARGDNATDDLAVFNAAATYCYSAGKKLVIPRRPYVLSSAWTITFPIDIEMDPSAILRFTNAASAGIVFDFRAAGSNFGLNSVRLGSLCSPAIDSSFNFPGYPSAWSSATRSTQDAITLMGGSRINIDVQDTLGWNAAFRPMGTYDATNGARGPQNINYCCNTADLCTYGVMFDSGPVDSGSINGIVVEFNTCFAKYPIYYNATNGSIGQCHARITGACFSNEAGGAIVYGYGPDINTCDIDVAWAYAGYSAYDSPTGTSTALTLPYVAGSTPSNGTSTDGNASVGYFGGSNNRIRVGAAIDQSYRPGGELPIVGAVTRVRDVGANNGIVIGFYEQTEGVAVALAATEGEANYNGGVGGASYSRKTLVSITVPTMANFSEVSFYCYNVLLSAVLAKPIRIVPVDSSIGNSKLNFAALDNSASVNRECIVQVTNSTGASVAGAVYYAWILVEV